jgi:hypothetical protein
LIDQPEVDLMHQGCRLKRVPRGLSPQVASSLPAELAVNQRKELV